MLVDICVVRADGLGDNLLTVPGVRLLLDSGLRVAFITRHRRLFEILFSGALTTGQLVLFDADGCTGGLSNLRCRLLVVMGPVARWEGLKLGLRVDAQGRVFISYPGKQPINAVAKIALGFEIQHWRWDNQHDLIANTANVLHIARDFLKASKLKRLPLVDEPQSIARYALDNYFIGHYVQGLRSLDREDIALLYPSYKLWSWGIDPGFFVRACDYLVSCGMRVVILMGPFEAKLQSLLELVRKLESRHRRVSVLRSTALEKHMELLCRAKRFIGVDSGPCHLAAFCGLPEITVVFPDDGYEYRVRRWRPLARNVRVTTIPASRTHDHFSKLDHLC